MSIELRILSGMRAGQSESFETPVVTVGRNPASDLRFDATGDLDVSTNHGEIRGADGRYTVHDNHSTNGTFVNGQRVAPGGAQELRDGDVVGFGAHGPTVSVRIAGGRTTPVGERITSRIHNPIGPVGARRPTTERVAIAVKQQTRGLRIIAAGSAIVLGALAVGAYMMGHREAAARDTQIQQLIAANEAATREFQARLQGINDTALTNSLRRRSDSLLAAAREARGGQQVALAQLELQRSHDLQRKFNDMDLPAVHDANDPAIVLITTELGGKAFEATGFSVNAAGLIVTNRHVVMDSGTRAARISVKFANTKNWIRAHIVKLAPSAEVDLALIQPDDAATYPAVHTIAGTVDTPVGGTIATLGFPLGTDVQMEGSGNDLVAKTSLTVGTVSKSVTDLLQIDSFAAHGSSGSPVFDAHGHVIGVVWGGPRDAAGRMVYAVPAPRIAELVRGAK